VLGFLEKQAPGNEEWTPTLIARELTLAMGTVRWALKKLKDDGKVFYRPMGKVHLYAATRQFTDDFNRLFKAHGTNQLYEVHGLTMMIKRDGANATPLGGGLGESDGMGGGFVAEGGVVRAGWGVRKAGKGETSFQLSRDSLVVWSSFTNCPCDYDRFVAWLARVDGFCLSRRWPGVEGNLGRWRLLQYGFNQDYLRFRNDSPTECVSLQGFKSWFARVYQKKEMDVLRSEIHSREEKTLEEFVGIFNGSMTTVQVIQRQELLTRQLSTLQASQGDMIKVIGRLADKVDELLRKRSSAEH